MQSAPTRLLNPIDPDPENTPPTPNDEVDYGWAARRAKLHSNEKYRMVKYCVEHDFLLIPGRSSAAAVRDTVANVLVNGGTTPDLATSEALNWIDRNWRDGGPFDITWYTTSGLVTGTLQNFRDNHQTK